jgi:hypothetical protein
MTRIKQKSSDPGSKALIGSKVLIRVSSAQIGSALVSSLRNLCGPLRLCG